MPSTLTACSTAVISSLVAPSSSAWRMWPRVPGAYMWVHDASTAIAMNSITFGSSTPEAIGCTPIAMNFSVQIGSSWANGSHAGFQFPVARSRSLIGVALGLVGLLMSGLLEVVAPRKKTAAQRWMKYSRTAEIDLTFREMRFTFWESQEKPDAPSGTQRQPHPLRRSRAVRGTGPVPATSCRGHRSLRAAGPRPHAAGRRGRRPAGTVGACRRHRGFRPAHGRVARAVEPGTAGARDARGADAAQGDRVDEPLPAAAQPGPGDP